VFTLFNRAQHDLDGTILVKDGNQVLETLGMHCLDYTALIGRMTALKNMGLLLRQCGLA
jgi:hypothetical protein